MADSSALGDEGSQQKHIFITAFMREIVLMLGEELASQLKLKLSIDQTNHLPEIFEVLELRDRPDLRKAVTDKFAEHIARLEQPTTILGILLGRDRIGFSPVDFHSWQAYRPAHVGRDADAESR